MSNNGLLNVIRDIHPNIASIEDAMNTALDWTAISSSPNLTAKIVSDNEELPWIGAALMNNLSVENGPIFETMDMLGEDTPMWMHDFEKEGIFQYETECIHWTAESSDILADE